MDNMDPIESLRDTPGALRDAFRTRAAECARGQSDLPNQWLCVPWSASEGHALLQSFLHASGADPARKQDAFDRLVRGLRTEAALRRNMDLLKYLEDRYGPDPQDVDLLLRGGAGMREIRALRVSRNPRHVMAAAVRNGSLALLREIRMFRDSPGCSSVAIFETYWREVSLDVVAEYVAFAKRSFLTGFIDILRGIACLLSPSVRAELQTPAEDSQAERRVDELLGVALEAGLQWDPQALSKLPADVYRSDGAIRVLLARGAPRTDDAASLLVEDEDSLRVLSEAGCQIHPLAHDTLAARRGSLPPIASRYPRVRALFATRNQIPAESREWHPHTAWLLFVAPRAHARLARALHDGCPWSPLIPLDVSRPALLLRTLTRLAPVADGETSAFHPSAPARLRMFVAHQWTEREWRRVVRRTDLPSPVMQHRSFARYMTIVRNWSE